MRKHIILALLSILVGAVASAIRAESAFACYEPGGNCHGVIRWAIWGEPAYTGGLATVNASTLWVPDAVNTKTNHEVGLDERHRLR
jgi:hypothetical protein